MNSFKKVVLFLKVTVCLLTQRTFGNVIHDIVLKYDNFKLYSFFSRLPWGILVSALGVAYMIWLWGAKFSQQVKNFHGSGKIVMTSRKKLKTAVIT